MMFKAFKRKIHKFLEESAAWIIARVNKPWMDRMNFKNVRLNLHKHHGLWVVTFLCTDFPFRKDNPLNCGANVVSINHRNERDLHVSKPASE